MILLGLDLETTGLNPKGDRVTEIGAVLWDARARRPIVIFNELINLPALGVSVPPEITAITGIDDVMLKNWGQSSESVFAKLLTLIAEADYIVAHNGTNFDRPFLAAELERFNLRIDKPWIDTSTDVAYPPAITTRKLVHLAAEHGFLNPFAHRAVFDVLTMLEVLSTYDIDDVIRWANSPSVHVKAIVSYDDREKAKAAGFRWNPENKSWIKTLKDFQVDDLLRADPGFKIEVLSHQ